MIQLEEWCEAPLLECLFNRSADRINEIPYDLFNKFRLYLIQEERYEDVLKLDSLKCKVVKTTWKEMLDNLDESLDIFKDNRDLN